MPSTTNPMRSHGVRRPTPPLLTILIMSTILDHPDWCQLLPKNLRRLTQLETARLTSHHTPKETMPGTMPSTTNPMRLSGARRLTLPHQTPSTGLSMSKVSTPESTQEIQPPFLLSKSKRRSIELRLTLSSSHMLLETTPGTSIITMPLT